LARRAKAHAPFADSSMAADLKRLGLCALAKMRIDRIVIWASYWIGSVGLGSGGRVTVVFLVWSWSVRFSTDMTSRSCRGIDLSTFNLHLHFAACGREAQPIFAPNLLVSAGTVVRAEQNH
jgi:hypothetical protein